ncbi:MAG: NADH:ubiquinone oxidoreductase [Desulfuromonas sp.]|nr:MAG: NADH:ubiquinone oxidoreductase [Desulfuromonas sp.]
MKQGTLLQLAYVRFTSCSGCQLMLLNCEEQLAELAELVALREFPLACSADLEGQPLDLALVEGSISTATELSRLLELRRRCRILVAVGSCALNGGINALVEDDRDTAATVVYGPSLPCADSFPPLPLHRFVKVDWRIAGCPPERHELVETLTSLLHGGWPGWQVMPVCMECRILERRCLLQEDRLPCLGPVTRAGCQARCPSLGVPCEGCRGMVAEANRDQLFRLLVENGMAEREIERRLQRFGGEL